MGRNYSLPFKKTNPRSIRTAEKRGWHVVEIPRNKDLISRETGNKLSWMGLEIWADRSCYGYWVNNFMTYKFAFEKEQDASAFIFQWCL